MDPIIDETQATVQATIVSCDIVGHGLEPEHSRQINLIRELNDKVQKSLKKFEHNEIVWASGGDGGHVAFLVDKGIVEAIELIRRLRDWADDQSIQLRITAHRGLVSVIPGADGRLQLVGEGINLCGSLVNFGLPHAVVVTSTFKNFVNNVIRDGISLSELEFRDERVVYLKHFEAKDLCLLYFAGDPPGDWILERSSQRKLKEAIASGNLWQIIYYMKRMLQIDSNDPQALEALYKIVPGSLMYFLKSQSVSHPLLGNMPRLSLLRFLQASQLIEREDGDIICRRDDQGDSMFIVLNGEIGVITRAQMDEADCPEPADIRIGEGGIVGELALALDRPRTATLQVVGPTALLAINRISLDDLLEREGRNSRLGRAFNNFLEERILEHICRNVPYLTLTHCYEKCKSGPEPWDRLIENHKIFEVNSKQLRQLSFGTKIDLPDGGRIDLSNDGLYILASGELIEAFELRRGRKQISGKEFDILYASIPGDIISIDRQYKLAPDNRAIIIWISVDGLEEYAKDQYYDIIERIRRRLASQMLFDAFIAYSSENEELANRWKDALEEAGLNIFVSKPERLKSFESEIDFALAESRVLVPIISRAALKTEWVLKEIDKRNEIFEEKNSNILPIETERGLSKEIAVGFTPVPAGRPGEEGERTSMEIVIKEIQAVKKGGGHQPFLKNFRISCPQPQNET
jgi:hypothetical protein